MNKYIFTSIFCLFAFCFSLYAQENNASEQSALPAQNEEDSTLYVINSFNYNIKGITKSYALNYKDEIKTGYVITGRNNLEKYIQDKTQILINQRTLKDNVRIEYTIAQTPDENGRYPVNLEIYTEDTWNIIALPYPKYDSNSGYELTIKARDYNFLGSMSSLRADIGYRYDENQRTYFNFMIDSNFPFMALGLRWIIDFDHDIKYRPDLEEPWFYKNTTGLSLELPIKKSIFYTGFAVSFIYNEEISESDKIGYGISKDFQEGLYLTLRPYTSLEIHTGLYAGSFGEIIYNPGISYSHNIELPDRPLYDFKKGPFFNFYHSLSFGRVDWKGNIREGLSLSIDNSIDVNFFNLNNDLDPMSYYYGIELRGYVICIDNLLGFSTRLNHRHWINSSYDYAGDRLRGISDKKIKAEYMVSFNFDFQFLPLKIRPSEWFPNFNFMRIFDFDMQLNPILDIAWYKPPEWVVLTDNDNILVSSGLELIVFPQRWRSLFFRISLAVDFSDFPRKTPMELFLGMELFY